MKIIKNLLIFSCIFLCNSQISPSIILNYSDILLDVLNATIFIDDKYKIINSNNTDCFMNILRLTTNYSLFTTMFPKIINNIGKGIDDIGNEVECRKTDLFAYYHLLYVKRDQSFMANDKNLSQFLNRSYLFYGFCLPMECQNLVEQVFVIMKKEKTIKIFNEHKINDIKLFTYGVNNHSNEENKEDNDTNSVIIRYDEEKEKNNILSLMFWICFLLFSIKLLVGYISKFVFPKGYEYYGYKTIQELNINEIKDDEGNENTTFLDEIKTLDSSVSNLRGDYNPKNDMESKYPFYLRVVKYFDLFNNINILGSKRNRYYNDNDIDCLCLLKSIVLFYVILSETINMLIILPNPSFFDYKFYISIGLAFYKRTINGLYFWILLESLTFSFKLMNFINQRNKNKENQNTKRAQFNYVVKQIFKFLCFYIPKIILFISIFFIFYYYTDNYACKLQSKMTYKFFVNNIIESKECYRDISKVFSPFSNYGNNASYDNVCFPFVYVYVNMFYSSLIFMIILIIVYFFQSPVIDKLISLGVLLNTLICYIYFLIKSSPDNGDNYDFDNFSGENYSLFNPHLFFSIYYFGCLLGFCFYYYINILNLNKKNRGSIKSTSTVLQSKENDEPELASIKSNIDLYYNEHFYNPMEFCSTFIKKIKSINDIIKKVLLIIYFIFILFLSLFPTLYMIKKINRNNDVNFYIEFEKEKVLKYFYVFEKLISLLLFSIFICVLRVLPKKYTISKIFRSRYFIFISRTGFIIICTYQSLVYISYCLFQFHIKITHIMIFNITIGLYTIITLVSFLISILFEIPIRIIIKNLLKDNDNKDGKKYKK